MNIEKFVLLLAWVFMVLSATIITLKFIGHAYYNSDMNKLERLQHSLQGITYRYRVKFWPYVFIFTACYLISHYYL